MKGKLFYTAKYLIFVTAIAQLALSQVHIDVITKVFAPSVGFQLFLFTIFGVLMAFNSSSYQHGKKVPLMILGCIAAVLTGYIYIKAVFMDISSANLITFVDAKTSIIVAITTIVIYAIGTPIMLATGNHNE